MLYNNTIIVRISEEEHTIINDLINSKNTDIKNVSEGVRACINFNNVVLGGYQK